MATSTSTLSWPEKTYLFNEQHRLVYCPIAKNACTSFKLLFFKISPLGNGGSVTGIHELLANENTGISLKDIPVETAQNILVDPSYFKFVLLRHPFKRVLSAYLDKFVTDTRINNISQPVIDWVYSQKGIASDYERSISFSDFVRYLVNHDINTVDTHWRSQISYLSNVSFDHIGCVENIDATLDILSSRAKLALDLDHMHQGKIKLSSSSLPGSISSEALCNFVPSELAKLGRLPSVASFLTDSMQATLREVYVEDFKLYESQFEVKSFS